MKTKILKQIQSFSKLITFAWLVIWLETIIFTQVATLLNFGDTTALQFINEDVLQIGVIICGFYFSTKCAENVAKGIEQYLFTTKEKTTTTAAATETFEEQDEYGEEPNMEVTEE